MQQLDRSKLIFAGAAALFLASAANSIASAQAPVVPPAPAATSHFKNLKVLPGGIPRDQLSAVMKKFTASLGVKCSFCHVGEEGKPLSTYDFASDANPHKDIAREMMRLTWRLNNQDLKAIDGLKDAKVSCFTCHRGAKEPLTEIPATPPPTG